MAALPYNRVHWNSSIPGGGPIYPAEVYGSGLNTGFTWNTSAVITYGGEPVFPDPVRLEPPTRAATALDWLDAEIDKICRRARQA